jgi:hypothetical protein
MDSRNSTGADTARTLYLPQTGEDGQAYVIVSRPDSEPEVRPFHTKEEACFWARQWMRRDRIARLEGIVFGTAWIEAGANH